MAELLPVISQRLHAYAHRRRSVVLQQGLGEALLVLFGGVLCVATIDGLAKPDPQTHRWLGILVYACSVLVLLVRGLVPLLRPRNLVTLAREVETHLGPVVEERLSSAVELAANPPVGVSDWMIQRTIVLAAREFAGLDPVALVSTAPLRRIWRRTGMVVAVLAVLSLIPSTRFLLLRALIPGINIARPASTRLVVDPGDIRLASGTALTLRLKADPAPGDAAVKVEWQDGLQETLRMRPTSQAGQFSLDLPALMQGLSYRVQAGDAESQRYQVTVDTPPRLKSVSLRIVPPAYTGEPARTIAGGDAEMLAGSQITVMATLTGPQAAHGSVLREPGETLSLRLDGDKGTCSWKAMQTTLYRLRLIGQDGLATEPAQQWRLRVRADRPPVAQLTGRGLEAGLAGRDEIVILDLHARDDKGLNALSLWMERRGRSRQISAIPLSQGSACTVDQAAAVDFQALGVQLGETVRLSLHAADIGGQHTASTPLELLIVAGRPVSAARVAARLRTLLKQVREQEMLLRRQRRIWSELTRVFRPEDPAAQRGTALVAQQQLTTILGQLATVSHAVHDEAADLDKRCQQLAFFLSHDLRAWVRARNDMIQRQATLATNQDLRQVAPILVTHDLVDAAAAELPAYRERLGLLVARVEAEGLVALADAANNRQARTVPVLEGYHGWQRPETEPKPGLLAEFYGNPDLTGPVIYTTEGEVKLINYQVPRHGGDNWSVRFTGEVRVPKDGDYTFTCTADDGVRLWVAGKELIGAQAWKHQGATPYSGKVVLKAGWHALEIRMFQGGGPSQLSFAITPPGGQPQPVSLQDLRHRSETEAQRQALVTKMVSLPRHILDGAEKRLERDYTVLERVPAVIEQMATDASSQALRDLAWRGRDAARVVGRSLDAFTKSGWSQEALRAAHGQAKPLTDQAKQARSQLERELRGVSRRNVPPGRVRDLLRSVTRLQQRAHDLPQLGRHLNASGRQVLRDRSRRVMQAELAYLTRTTDAVREAFITMALDRSASLAERQQALLVARQLFDPAHEGLQQVNKALSMVLKEENAQPWSQGAQRALQVAHKAYSAALAYETYAQRSHVATQAQTAQQAQSALREAQKRSDLLQAEAARHSLDHSLQALTAFMRQQGDFTTAGKLAAAQRADPPRSVNRGLAHLLSELAKGPKADTWRMGDELDQETQHLKGPTADERLRILVRLSDARIKLDLTSASWDQYGHVPEARTYGQVGQDLEALLAEPKIVSAQTVKPLADRIAALEGRHGEQQRQQVLAAAAAREAQDADKNKALADARELQALSEAAKKAAADAKQRPGLLEDLQALAGDKAEAPTPLEPEALALLAADAEKRLEALRKLEQALQQAQAEEMAARAAFAATEQKVAKDLGNLQPGAKDAGHGMADQGLANALAELGKLLPAEAKAINDLAGQALKAPQPEATAPAAETLAQQAADIEKQAQAAAALAGRALDKAQALTGGLRRDAATQAGAQANQLAWQQREALALHEAAQSLAKTLPDRARTDEKRATVSLQAELQQATEQAQAAARANERGRTLTALQAQTHDLAQALQKRTGDADPDAKLREQVQALANAAAQVQARAEAEAQAATHEAAALAKQADRATGELEAAHQARLAVLARERERAKDTARLAEAAKTLAAQAAQALEEQAPPATIGKQPEQRDPKALAAALTEKAKGLATDLGLAGKAAEAAQANHLAQHAKHLQQAGAAAKALAASTGDKARKQKAQDMAATTKTASAAAEAQLRQGLAQADARDQAQAPIRQAEALAGEALLEAAEARDAAKRLAGATPVHAAEPQAAAATPDAAGQTALAQAQRHAERAEHLAHTAALKMGVMEPDKPTLDQLADAADALQARANRAQQRAAEAQKEADTARGLEGLAGEAAKQAQAEAKRTAQAQGQAKTAADKAKAEQALDTALHQAEAKAMDAHGAREKTALRQQEANLAQNAALQAQQAAHEALKQLLGAGQQAVAGKEDVKTVREPVRDLQHLAREARANAAQAGKNANQAEGASQAHLKQHGRDETADRGALEQNAAAADKNREQAKAAKAAADALTQGADALASALAQATGQPQPLKALTSQALANEGLNQADQMEQGLAKPLADAYRQTGPAPKTADKVKKAGALGQRLAELAAEQRRAAETLAESLAKKKALQDALRGQLAAGLTKAAQLERALDGLPAAMSDAPLSAGENAATALQQQANQAQHQATQAQAAASQALAQAQALAQKAAAAPADQAAASQQQAAQAGQTAAAAQLNAVQAQGKALAQQQQAAQALQAQGMDTAVAAQAMQSAAANLQRAQANSQQAMANAKGAAAGPMQAAKTGAAANLQQADAALAQANQQQLGLTQGLASRLQQAAAQARQAGHQAQAQAQLAGAAQSAQAAAPKGRAAASQQAARSALGQIQAAPQSSQAYQSAATGLASAASQMRQASQPAPSASAPAAAAAPGQTASSSGSGSRSPSKPGVLDGFDTAETDAKEGDWARLPDTVRRQVRRADVDRFAEEQQETIRAYFRRLGEE